MKLSADMQKALVGEIRYVAETMPSKSNPVDKMYIFSAAFGMAQRVFNFEYDPELVFMYQVLSHAHAQVTGRLTAVAARQEGGTGIPQNLFVRLEKAMFELSRKLAKNEEIYSVLQDISNLAYATTGNGYYLNLRGALKV